MKNILQIFLIGIFLTSFLCSCKKEISEMDLYTCLIEEKDPVEPFVQVFWARANDLGTAIEIMVKQAKENGFRNPYPRECDPYDIENLEGDVEPNSSANVFWATHRFSFPPEEIFDLPQGVVASCIEGDFDTEQIESGYKVYLGENNLQTLIANVNEGFLEQTYSELISQFPTYRVFWYQIHDFYANDSVQQFFINESINTPKLISGYINQNRVNSLENGLVTLTSYLEEGATNFNITDHKQISVVSYSPEIIESCTNKLESLGFQASDEFINISEGFHHWHYKSSEALEKDELISLLNSQGFSEWNPNGGNRGNEN